MAMAPKKKYEYFDRGRGISDLSFCDSNEHSDSSSSSNSPHPQPFDASPSGSSTRHSSPFQGPPSPLDYPLNTMSPHLPYTSPQTMYHAPPYHDYGQGLAIGNPYVPQGPETSSSSSSFGAPFSRFIPGDHHRGGYPGAEPLPGEITPTYTVDEDDDEALKTSKGQKGQNQIKTYKRPQRCRMCANHQKTVDMKGHKWYCPYRACTCNDCDITRKTQYYMKERQKLTRHQQQQQHHHCDRMQGPPGLGTPDATRKKAPDQGQMDFPRVEEMVNQTKNILDYDLFEKVNRACRPRSSSNIPQ